MQPRIRTDRPAPRSSRDLVLTALRARGPMSRAELARQAGVAPSTISGVVQELAAAGLVVAAPQPAAGRHSRAGSTAGEAPRPGRPGLRLTLNPRLGAVAGVEFCFDKVRVLLCDLAHNVVATAECDLPHAHSSDTALAAAGTAGRQGARRRRAATRRAHRRRGLGARPGPPPPGHRHAVGDTPRLARRDRRRHRRGPRRRGQHRQRLQPGRARRARLGRGARLRRQRDAQVPLRHRVRPVRQRHPRPRQRRRGRDRPHRRRRARAAVPLRQARLPGNLRGDLRHHGGAAAAARRADAARSCCGCSRRATPARCAWSATRPSSSARTWPPCATCSRRGVVIVTGPMARAGRAGPRPDQGRDPPAHRAQRGPARSCSARSANRNTALGAIALALDETDWLPARRARA